MSTTPTTTTSHGLASVLAILSRHPNQDEAVLSALAVLAKHVDSMEFTARRDEIFSNIGGAKFLQRMLNTTDMFELAVILIGAFTDDSTPQSTTHCGKAMAEIRIPSAPPPSNEHLHHDVIRAISNLAPYTSNTETICAHVNILVTLACESSSSDIANLAFTVLTARFSSQITAQHAQRIIAQLPNHHNPNDDALVCLAHSPTALDQLTLSSVLSLIEFVTQIFRHRNVQQTTRSAAVQVMCAICPHSHSKWTAVIPPAHVVVLCQITSIEIAVAFEHHDAKMDLQPETPLQCTVQLFDTLVGFFQGPEQLHMFSDVELRGLIAAVDRAVMALCTWSSQVPGNDENDLAIVSCIVTCLHFFLVDDELTCSGLLAVAKSINLSKSLSWLIRRAGPILLPYVVELIAKLWVFSDASFDTSTMTTNDVVTLLSVTTLTSRTVYAGLVVVSVLDSMTTNINNDALLPMLANAVNLIHQLPTSAVNAVIMHGISAVFQLHLDGSSTSASLWMKDSSQYNVMDNDDDDEEVQFQVKSVAVLRRILMRQ